MRPSAVSVALAGTVAASPAPAPTPAAVLEREFCDIDWQLGRPIQPPPDIKAWIATATQGDVCTDVMPASVTSGWMEYLGELSSFVAHAPESTDVLTDLCGSATYTVKITFCTDDPKIIVTDKAGQTLSTISNTVRNPGSVVLTSANGKIGVAASATGAATDDDDDGDDDEDSKTETTASPTGTGPNHSSATKTSSKGTQSTGAATTSAATTSGDATKSGGGATETPAGNGAGKVGAGAMALGAGLLAVIAL